MAKKRRSSFLLIAAIVTLVIVLLVTMIFAACDARLKTTEYEIRDARIKGEARLVFLSDLHRSRYGEDQKDLLAAVDAANPDAVFLGGDIFDEHGDYEIACILLEGLTAKYPCYFVSGNHEYGFTSKEQFDELHAILRDTGVVELSGEKRTLTFGDCTFDLYGIDNEMRYITYRAYDPFCAEDRNFYADLEKLSEEVDPNRFSLLLCHAPLPEELAKTSFDLVLSGHTHGGQWRFPPFVNGVYAPGQGLFPRCAYGRYALSDQTTLIVGSGLCTTYTLPRVFNRPEILLIKLSCTEE